MSNSESLNNKKPDETANYSMLGDLSLKEYEVATLVVKGLKNREVAAKMGILENSVKFHLTNIFKKLKIKSRSELIILVLGSAPQSISAGGDIECPVINGSQVEC